MSRAAVYTERGGRPVKNLGWLLRHAGEINSITIDRGPEGRGEMSAWGTFPDSGEVFLFRTTWESFGVLNDWLVRHRSLHHARMYSYLGEGEAAIMAKLTRKQAASLEYALRNAERARAYLFSDRTAVCMRKPPSTTLDYVRPSDGQGLVEVERAYGSDLTGLDNCIAELRNFLDR